MAAAVFRYDRFGAGAYDLGIFDQTIWRYSRFQLGPDTVKGVPLLLGDHFHPIIALAAPLYWIWADPRMLLALQGVLLASASVPLYAYARGRVGEGAGLVVQATFLVFVGVWSAALFDFHEVAFAAPLLALALWALEERRFGVLVAACLAGGLVKEDVALLFGTVALFSVMRFSGRGLALGALGLALVAWSALLTTVVIPALAERSYAYWSYGALGNQPGTILATIGHHPLLPLRLFVDRGIKVATLLGLLGSFAFLPLLSPLCLLAILPLAERFWNQNPTYWNLHFHYSLTVAPILAFAAVDGLARLRRARLAIPAVHLTSASVVTGITLASWHMSALDAGASAATDRCLSDIPATASVVATDALVPHLSRRARIYTPQTLPPDTLPDAIAVNLAAQHDQQPTRDVVDAVRRYRVVCRGGGTVVAERVTSLGLGHD